MQEQVYEEVAYQPQNNSFLIDTLLFNYYKKLPLKPDKLHKVIIPILRLRCYS